MSRKKNSEEKKDYGTMVVNEMIDLNENYSFAVVDAAMHIAGTTIIRDGKIKMFHTNSEAEDFETPGDYLQYLSDNNLYVIKHAHGDHLWKDYNPNPLGKNTGDCSIRSYCAAFGVTWDQAFDIATKIAKNEKCIPDAVNVCDKVLTEHFHMVVDEEYSKINKNDRLTVNEFTMMHPVGTYVVTTRGHQIGIKNGEYWDSWDSGDKKITKIYKMPGDKI